MARHFSSSLCHLWFKSLRSTCRRPEMEPLGTGWERGKWGVSCKGIITVSPEVHNHSVKQTGSEREKSTSGFLLEFLAHWQFHMTAGRRAGQQRPIMELKKGSQRIQWPLISLFSMAGRPQGPTYLCCWNPWVPSGPAGCRTVWLFDRVSSEDNIELLRPGLKKERRERKE